MAKTRRPTGEAKGYVRNLLLEDDYDIEHPSTLTFSFRPGDAKASIGAAFGQIPVMGMSHQYDVFQHTENMEVTFTVYYNALMMLKEKGSIGEILSDYSANSIRLISDEIERARRFLESLLYPGWTPAKMIGSKTPECIMCLPGIVAMRCRLVGLALEFLNTTAQGNITELRMSTTWRDAPTGRVTMQDVLTQGSFRGYGG